MSKLNLRIFKLNILTQSLIIFGAGFLVLLNPATVLGYDTPLNTLVQSTPPEGNTSSCSIVQPKMSPDLLQVDTASTSATLYFVPVKDQVTDYLINYGYSQNNTGFMAAFIPKNPNWIITHKIDKLSPNTTYYFKVSAVDDCSSGPASNILGTQTAPAGSKNTITVYKGLISVLNGKLQINSKGESVFTITLPFLSESLNQPGQNQPNPDSNSKNWLIDTISSIENSFKL